MAPRELRRPAWLTLHRPPTVARGMVVRSIAALASIASIPLLAAACSAPRDPVVPSRELSLRRVVLYQNGVGYFERTGALKQDRVRLQLRPGEVDGVLKTLVVVESGAAEAKREPSTVTVRLPHASRAPSAPDEAPTWLDVILSPRPRSEISIAYAVPTAAWKSTYRVILPEEAERSKGVLLQAWALIDNVSEEDWENVKLTLATGAPLTFETDLRSPRFGSRPSGGTGSEALVSTGPMNRRVSSQIESDPRPSEAPAPGSFTSSSMAKTGSSSAMLRDVAGMIRYDIPFPVSIPRSSSTLVTIINDYIPGEEIFLYRPDPAMPGSDKYPMRTARLENKSGFGFQGGPVAIYGGGMFVGEGLIRKLDPGDTALIPYGIDSSTSVQVEASEVSKPVRLVAVARGVMTVEDSRVVTSRYTIKPGAQVPPRLFVRHGRMAGFTVGQLPPGTETTDEAYLIPIPITARKESLLSVEERQSTRQGLSILSTDGAKLSSYLEGGGLSAETEKRVRDVLAVRIEVGRINLDIEAIRAQLGDAAQRSGELRESLRAIERTPRANAVQQRLLDRLAEATKQAAALSTKLSSRSDDLEGARARLAEALRDFRVEEKSVQF